MQQIHPKMRVLAAVLIGSCAGSSLAARAFERVNQTLSLASGTTRSLSAEIAQPVEPITFVLAGERLPSGKFTLSNGVVVSRSDWPALVFAKFGTASCSGALIGPNVLLTAAHCVEDKGGKVREAVLTIYGERFEMRCEQHPHYVRRPLPVSESGPRGAEDYALCSIDYHGRIPKVVVDMRVEVLDTSSKLMRRDAVLLTGYGCVDVRIMNGKVVSTASANVLRIGDASIARAPTRKWSDAAYVLIDSRGRETPALCPGDSGGPMFVGATESRPKGMRRIAGVNSAITAGASGRPDHIVSKVSATVTSEFRKWVLDWQQRNASLAPIVCGVSREAGTFPCGVKP